MRNTAGTARITRTLSAVLLGGSLLSPASASGQHFPPSGELERLLRYQVEDGAAPAMALGLLHANGSSSVLTYGEAGSGKAPLGPGTSFELGNVTMTFTATLLALMADRGEVSLDDPVSRYLPDSVHVPSLRGRQITLRDLAEHRSGLPAEPPEPYSTFTLDDLYALLSEADVDYPPGQEFEFSPLGYGLLGHALARAAGTPLPDLLSQRVLRPLGMDRTGYELEGELENRAARGHNRGEVVPRSVAGEVMRGATGLRSTPADMLRYLEANARPTDAALGRAMRRAQRVRPTNDPAGEGWGFAWRQYVEGDEPLLVTHAGQTDGFTSLITFDRERGIGTVLLANGGDARPWFSRNLLWLDPWPTQTGDSVDPNAAKEYAGTYSTTAGRYMAVADQGRHFVRVEEDGRLSYQRPGAPRVPLEARTDSSFYMVGAPFTLTFGRRGEDMQMVASVDEREPLRAQGQRWRAWRVDASPPPLDGTPLRGIGGWVALGGLLATVAAAAGLTFWQKRKGS
jgi:D-alanyl-D-alanine-carboxypeptidase/D-alanyl-D-alanine-endopeptidase